MFDELRTSRSTPVWPERRPARPFRVVPPVALALALACVGRPAPVAGAISPPSSSPIVAMRHALAAVTSYQVDITVALNGQQQPARYTLVAVRSGRALRIDVHYNTGDMESGPTVVGEDVIEGSRICERSKPSERFSCKTSPADAKGESGFESNTFLANFPATTAPIGSKRIGGQSCDGYRVEVRAKDVHDTGNTYVAHAMHLPCSMNITSVAPDEYGDKQTGVIAMTWSRFNDRTLTVPRMR